MASSLPLSSECRTTSPCWLDVDAILRQRLSIFHHSLGIDIVDPATAAEDFLNALRGLLLEQGIITVTSSSGPKGPHRLRPIESRPIESTLRNLSPISEVGYISRNGTERV